MPLKLILVGLLALICAPTFGKSLDKQPVEKNSKPKISIVIDDLGDNSIIARQLLSLSASMTAAILPHTPHAQPIAEFATARGHEVIMHLPMEAFTRPDLLGPGALFANMPKGDLQRTIDASAETIPNLVGFNNHMGSLLTENPEKMRWVMERAKQKGWYFLDSKTSESSVAQEIAGEFGLPTIGRDVFLDHHTEEDTDKLHKLFNLRIEKAKKIARHRGQVVIICHPYPETLAFLKSRLPELNQDYQLVSLSELVRPKNSIKKIASLNK